MQQRTQCWCYVVHVRTYWYGVHIFKQAMHKKMCNLRKCSRNYDYNSITCMLLELSIRYYVDFYIPRLWLFLETKTIFIAIEISLLLTCSSLFPHNKSYQPPAIQGKCSVSVMLGKNGCPVQPCTVLCSASYTELQYTKARSDNSFPNRQNPFRS